MHPGNRSAPLGSGAEFDRIRGILAGMGFNGGSVIVPPGDDAAVIDVGQLAISTDMSFEGVHFRLDWVSPAQVAFRAVMAAVSDLAAMAADPVGVLTSLAVPEGQDGAVIDGLGKGIREACALLRVPLLGGDLSRSSGPLAIDVIALGRADDPAQRGGAEPGDEVWVSGLLGGAAAAVLLLDRGDAPPSELMDRFARPVPRIREAQWLQDRGTLHGLIDLSDGIGGDAGHLAAASGAGVVIDWTSLPVHPTADAELGDPLARRLALSGGEDYELCCILPPGQGDELAPEFRVEFGVPLTRVGWVEEGSGVRVLDAEGNERPAGGFDHFSEGDS
jgi:thiamine-monophosphate kinase